MKNTTMKTDVLLQAAADVEATGAAFIKKLSTINHSDFNRVPFNGGWTVAQVAQHVLLSVTGTIAIFNAPVMKTERDPGKYINAIKDMFLDFDARYTSAATLIPANGPYDQKKLTGNLAAIFDELQQNVKTKDLTETCLAAELPGMGHITRLEWAYLAVYHSQRHDHQVKNIVGRF